MSTEIEKSEQQPGHAAVLFSQQQMQLLKDVVAPGLTDQELQLFSQVCQRTGLDPFSRQIYAIKRNRRERDESGNWTTKKVMVIQTSIDGFRLTAQRSGRYAGQTPVEWCDRDGVWTDVWLKPEPPAAARVGVYSKGFAEPLKRVAHWKDFAPTNDKGEPTGQWRSMAPLMLAKTAEAQALRAAFPAEMSGIYTEDEMAGAEVPAAEQRPERPPADPATYVTPAEPVLTWDEMMARLNGVDPTVKWEALAADVIKAMYSLPLSVDDKANLRERMLVLIEALEDICPPGSFPLPTVEQYSETIALSFDGLLVDVEAHVETPPADDPGFGEQAPSEGEGAAEAGSEEQAPTQGDLPKDF